MTRVFGSFLENMQGRHELTRAVFCAAWGRGQDLFIAEIRGYTDQTNTTITSDSFFYEKAFCERHGSRIVNVDRPE